MVLPITVRARVADIWQAYIAESLMPSLGQHVAFTSPIVSRIRNERSVAADLQSEASFYTHADGLTKWLAAWKAAKGRTAIRRQMEQLIIDLYELGVVEETDIRLYQAWLQDLDCVGYVLPELRESSVRLKQPKVVER